MNLWIDTQALIVISIVAGLLLVFLKTDVFVRRPAALPKEGESAELD